MTVVSSKEFATNQNKYFDWAVNEQGFIQRENNMFIVQNVEPDEISEPDEDFYNSIPMEEVRNRIVEYVRKKSQKEMSVYAKTEVIEDLENLIDILFEKGYFSYEESSVAYVVDLFEDILKNLPSRIKKTAPKFFTDRFGKPLYYAVFPKSKHTHW